MLLATIDATVLISGLSLLILVAGPVGGGSPTRKAARHPSCRHWPPTPGAGGRPGEEEEDGEGGEEERSRGGPAVQPPTPPALFIIGGEERRDQSEGRRGGKRRPSKRPERSQLAPRLLLAEPRSQLSWASFFDRHIQHLQPPVTEVHYEWKHRRRVQI